MNYLSPYNTASIAEIKLKNNESEAVCFKIKTTVPTKYLVSPTYGNVESGETVSIRVKLLPSTYNPLEYIKHKFLVQTMPAPLNGIDHEKMWSKADPAIIREKKLLCVFREISAIESLHENKSSCQELEGVTSRTVTENATLEVSRKQRCESTYYIRCAVFVYSLCVLNFLFGIIYEKRFDIL
ncbi:vesicle-associated membrane protein-associated protein A-like isoform X2 [Centruroides sculpturatus]|uniref:vesicle-associated membrane protein-associated protein A-like isoform X2 n=1 Tax=Centruroides sculpturatus TaxID=218467 RepID=UPI000C6D633D|nr:vesicle-associated membrane protein-associated protein A-like isoform X2 [Centruroides sculpturatus]